MLQYGEIAIIIIICIFAIVFAASGILLYHILHKENNEHNDYPVNTMVGGGIDNNLPIPRRFPQVGVMTNKILRDKLNYP